MGDYDVDDLKKRRLKELLIKSDGLVDRLKTRMRALHGVSTLSSSSSSTSLEQSSSLKDHFQRDFQLSGAHLRDYQEKGVQWMMSLHESGLNGEL